MNNFSISNRNDPQQVNNKTQRINNFPISDQNDPYQVNNDAQGLDNFLNDQYQVNNKTQGMNNFPMSNQNGPYQVNNNAQGLDNFPISNRNDQYQVNNNAQGMNNIPISNRNDPYQVNNNAQGMNNSPISNRNDPYQVNNDAQGLDNFPISNRNDQYQVNNKTQGMNNFPNSNQNDPNQVNNRATYPYNTNQQGGNQQIVQINNYVNLDVPPEQNQQQEEPLGISDKSIRVGFVRKVYSILLVQLILTVAMCCYSMQNSYYLLFQRNNIFVLVIAIVILLITLVSIRYSKFGRTVPTNYILLILFTLCEGYLASFLCTIYNPRIVVLAAIYTLVVTLSLTLYAMTHQDDFAGGGTCLMSIITVLFLSGFFLIFTHDEWYSILFCIIWAFIYAAHIVYDTEKILGQLGFSFSPDDYISASMTLYIDIIVSFIDLIQIVGFFIR